MRIGIVNDLPVVAEGLRRYIADHGGHEVAWVAHSGEEAVQRCRSERPDLILMDLRMDGMDGVEATKLIMTSTPCAILLVTASISGNSEMVFRAMGAGAIDVVPTPSPEAGPAALYAKIDSLTRLLGQRVPRTTRVPVVQTSRKLVAIGSSAGGPAALSILLAGLPEDLDAAIIIVQHVDAEFAPGLADWLGTTSKMPVRLARDGEPPQRGTVLIAGTNDHLVLRASGALGTTPHPQDSAYRPGVDVFFESAARHWRGDLLGVLLTGMGRDGANGLKKIRGAGHHTIAQDQASSAVYGMPKAAAELNAAVEILPLDSIAAALTARCGLKPPTP